MTPKGKKGLKEIWKRDEEDPNVINLTNQNGEIDDEVAILDGILTARIHPHRLHPSELVEGKDFIFTYQNLKSSFTLLIGDMGEFYAFYDNLWFHGYFKVRTLSLIFYFYR